MTLPQTASAPLRLLVSVRDPGEAECACAAGLDLVDAKDPERGALGALPPAVVGAIRARVAGRAVTSAVAGEPEAADLAAAVRAFPPGEPTDATMVVKMEEYLVIYSVVLKVA